MYTIAICDDDELFLSNAVKSVRKASSEISMPCEVLGFYNSQIMLSEIAEDVNRFDIYILDMEMPHAHGFELIKAIRDKSPIKPIIILTSYMSYAIDSFEFDILRYIPKDELEERLPSAMTSAFNIIKNNNYLMLSNEREIHKVFFYEIAYIEKEQKYAIIYLSDGRIMTKRTSLNALYMELDDTFVYANRGCIVNLSFIEDLTGSKLRLRLGNVIRISPNYLLSIKQSINKYIRTNF